MRQTYLISFVSGLVLIAIPEMASAGDPASSPEARLRESLRNTMLQLRSVESERDTLKAAHDQNEQEKKALSEKLDAVTKQCIEDKAASDKRIGDLEGRETAKDDQIAKLNEALEKWKTAYNQVADIARTKEGERAKLAGEKVVLERKVADREARNLELFKVGNEILSRYEKFGLGTALTAREPFTGITKVKLENLVQDYGDKLSEQKIKPEPNAARSSQAPEANPTPAPAKAKTDSERSRPASNRKSAS